MLIIYSTADYTLSPQVLKVTLPCLVLTLHCGLEMWQGMGVGLCHLQPLLFVADHFAVQESLVSEEIVHDLDTCEVTVEGEELNPEQESLEVDVARLQQKGIEVSHSDLGVVFTGEGLVWSRG